MDPVHPISQGVRYETASAWGRDFGPSDLRFIGDVTAEINSFLASIRKIFGVARQVIDESTEGPATLRYRSPNLHIAVERNQINVDLPLVREPGALTQSFPRDRISDVLKTWKADEIPEPLLKVLIEATQASEILGEGVTLRESNVCESNGLTSYLRNTQLAGLVLFGPPDYTNENPVFHVDSSNLAVVTVADEGLGTAYKPQRTAEFVHLESYDGIQTAAPGEVGVAMGKWVAHTSPLVPANRPCERPAAAIKFGRVR